VIFYKVSYEVRNMTEEVTKLIKLREKFNLPRSYLSWRLGCSEFTLFRWEKQISTPSPAYRTLLRRLLRNFPGGDI